MLKAITFPPKKHVIEKNNKFDHFKSSLFIYFHVEINTILAK